MKIINLFFLCVLLFISGCQTANQVQIPPIPTSGTATLNFIGYPTEEAEGFIFASASVNKNNFPDISGADIANVGSFLWAPGSPEGTGVIDMGIVSLESITEALDPNSNIYSGAGLGSEETKAVNHVACVRTRDGKYAKCKVISYSQNVSENTTTFVIQWQYQPSGSRTLY